jgi:predicted esterase
MINDPHYGQPILTAGAPLSQARVAMIMIHGRGASAESILMLAEEFKQPDFAYMAPQAADGTWYPNRFLAPTASNEPWLSSALATVDSLVGRINSAGIPAERLMLLGFSQGACLALEYAARNAKRYGGVIGLSGGVIGADGEPRRDKGNFLKTPIFLGCSEVDFHIPKERIEQSAKILRELDGEVTMRLYPNMDHTVNHDEIKFVRELMKTLTMG